MALWQRLKNRGVPRVAVSYLVIAWLILQIGDVVLDPLGAPEQTMLMLIVLAVIGFPIALVLAWFFEITPEGIERDTQAEGETRPAAVGVRRYADVIIIGFLLVVVAVLLSRDPILSSTDVEKPVVAVLPFEEFDSVAENHFGDGVSQTLIQKLGLLDQVVVLASSSSFEFRGALEDLVDVGKKLEASALLMGSLRRTGGLLRLDARLVDAGTGQQLWATRFSRPVGDVFQIQDEIVNEVTAALSLQLSESQVARIGKPPTTSLPAYEVFVRASREALESRDPERMPEALQYLYDAIELDPEFALAHATLVEALHLTASWRKWDTHWEDIADEARAAAARAQELDPELGEGYFAEALVAMWEKDEGLVDHTDAHIYALAEKALELSPNSAPILKNMSAITDDPERDFELLTRAARIDPRSGIIKVNIAEGLLRQGAYDQAEEWLFRAARTKEPYFGIAYKLLVEENRLIPERLAIGARWGRAWESRYPEDVLAKHAYLRLLIELGAWSEAEGVIANAGERGRAGDEYMKWVETYQGQWVALAQGRDDQAAELAERHVLEMLKTLPKWPDLTKQPPHMLNSLDLLAMRDIRQNNASVALERYENAGLTIDNMLWYNGANMPIRQAVVFAVLHRYVGQPERAELLLRGLLEEMSDTPISGDRGKGFTEFVIHAFLGETDGAIVALQQVVDEGFLFGWWGLEFGDFDANYAAVLEDARFKALHSEVLSLAAAQRDAFRQNPAMPHELLVKAGLEPDTVR